MGIYFGARKLLKRKPSTGTLSKSPDQVSGLLLWFKADSGDLYQESSRSTLVTANNDPVGSWTNKGSSSGANPGCNGAYRGTYKTGQYNGLPCVNFSGSGQFMNDENFPAQGTNDFTYFVVASSSDISAQRTPFWIGKDDPSGCFGMEQSSAGNGKLNLHIGGGAWVYTGTSPTISNGVPFLLICKKSGTTISVYVNGSAANPATSVGTVNIASTGVQIAAQWSATTPGRWAGDLMEMGYYNSALSDSDISAIGTHLKTRWGIA